MLEIFQYSFMVRAFVAGILVAAVVPLLGGFLVARRYSLIADSLAHISLVGVGAGLLLGTSPIVIAVPVTVAGALGVEWLRQSHRVSGETSLAIMMSSGLALAVVLANLAHGGRVDFASYLFGSITTTQNSDLVVLLVSVIGISLVIAINYRALVYASFDEDGARIAGNRVNLLNYLLTAMTALIVVLSLRIVGGLLIGALLVIPIVTAAQFARSFAHTLVLAVLDAMVAVVAGLFIAFYVGIAAGGAIVLSALALMVLSLILHNVLRSPT